MVEPIVADPGAIGSEKASRMAVALSDQLTVARDWLRIGCGSCGFLPRYSALCIV